MDKHYAKFYGDVIEVKYRYGREWGDYLSSFLSVYSERKNVGNEVIWEGLTDQPLIEENEIVLIPSLNIETKITKRVKNVEGGYIYYTGYTVKETVDEESKLKAEEDEKANKKYREEQREEERRKIEIKNELESKLSNKKWYQFWK